MILVGLIRVKLSFCSMVGKENLSHSVFLCRERKQITMVVAGINLGILREASFWSNSALNETNMFVFVYLLFFL